MDTPPPRPEPSARASELLAAALLLPPSERKRFVSERCGSDGAMRDEVLNLLARAGTDGSGPAPTTPGIRWRRRKEDLAGPAAAPEPAPSYTAERGLPERIGNCVIKRCLGEGGMGIVYEGEQQNPRRRVAVKLMRADTWSASLVSRFRREAELLGRLEHPGIARVYEAGHARPWGDKGPELPYLVMELVDGSPITVHAARLDARQRLRLIGLICDAVQHAHERGVVHRDLKPANVLVDASGQPRVLDFGVARALDGEAQGHTAHTGTSQLVGTLPYMSPEQVAGKSGEIGPRSDVYSLGVLAYELLCGQRPIPMAGLSLAEAVHQVQNVEPPRLGSIDPQFSGDVEAIVGKALEKEPGRRYASAAEMAADIERHLGEQPIQARPPSAVYRATKFVRRNRLLVGVMAGLVTALAAGIAATSYMAIRATRARDDADRSSEQARRLSYRSSLAAAAAALEEPDAGAARSHLNAAPPELREWTWRHLSSRLDDAAARLELGAPPGGRSGLIVPREDGRVAVLLQDGVALVNASGGSLALERMLAGPIVAISRDGRRVLELREGHWRDRSLDGAADDVDLGASSRADALPRRSGGWILSAVDDEGNARTQVRDREGRLAGSIDVQMDGLSAVSPDDRFLVTSPESRLVVAELVTGGRIAELDRRPSALAFLPDGRTLIAVDAAGLATAWRLDGFTRGAWSDVPVATIPVHEIAVTAQGTRFACVDQRGAVRLWRVADGQLERDLGEVGYSNHAAALSRDGSTLALGDALGGLRLVDLGAGGRGAIAVGGDGPLAAIAFLADDTQVVALDREGSLRLFLESGRRASPRLAGHTSFVYDVAVNAQGQIASIAWDGSARIWDAHTGTLQRVLTLSEAVGRVVALLPDAIAITACGAGASAWDMATGAEVARLPEGHAFRSLEPLAGTHRVLFGTADGRIGWWEPRALPAGRGEVGWFASAGVGKGDARVALTASGSTLAWARGEALGTLDVATGAAGWTTELACDAVLAVDISGDGRSIAAACADGALLLLDGRDGHVRHVLAAPGGPAFFAARFHPQEPFLATGSRDGSLVTWDLERGEMIAQMRSHLDYIHGLAFSPDGAFLVSGSGDATVRIWETRSPAELAARAPR